jgi:Tfp pilus assembly protein PilF
LQYLKQAATLAPDNARYAYVWGVALHSSNRIADGIAVLATAHQRHPANRDVLVALATFEHQRGNDRAAREYASQLQKLAPGDPGVAALMKQLTP